MQELAALEEQQPAHLLRGLDLDQVDGLAEAGLRCELAGVQHPPAGGDDLAASAVDGVSVHHHIAHLHAAPGIVTRHPTHILQNNEPYLENIFDSRSRGLSFHHFQTCQQGFKPLSVTKQE